MEKFKSVIYIVIVSILLLTSSCKTVPKYQVPKNNISENDLLSGELLLGHKVDMRNLPNASVMDLTPEMEAFLDKYVLNIRSKQSRARALNKAIFDTDKLAMIYDTSKTYTASQAFENKSGNCLAFSFLYTALARKAGLDVSFQEVKILPEWQQVNDELSVESRHVNLNLSIKYGETYVVDIDNMTINRQFESKEISENHATAFYFGNLAATYIVSGDTENAFRYLLKAINLAPQEPSLWSSLGVLYRRAGYNEHAKNAYFIALKNDKYYYPAIGNLSYMYKQMGNEEQAEFFTDIADDYQSQNPYYRYVKAQKSLQEGDYKQAIKHLNFAIGKRNNEKRFYQLKSEIYEKMGDFRNAEKTLRKLEEIDQS